MRTSVRGAVALLFILAVLMSGFPALAQEGEVDKGEKEFPAEAALPDLRTKPITDLRLVVDASSGERLLRFSNLVANVGDGPLEIYGTIDEDDPSGIIAHQHIYGDDETIVEPLEGTFYFSGQHMHWHWEGLAAYEIWTIETSGALSRKVISNDKVGFCLRDSRRADRTWVAQNTEEDFTAAADREYSACRLGRQGISTGWVDVYQSTLPGQALDITDLADGVYALRSVADPLDAIYELDSTNNDTVLYFAIHDDELIILGEEFSLFEYFEQLVDAGKIEVKDDE
jgi:hypothetical protein